MTTALPRGPEGHLLTGNLSEFARDRLGLLNMCARGFGDFVPLRFGPMKIVLINRPAYIEDVLVTKVRNFRKSYQYHLNDLLFGSGLLTSEGDLWLRQRRLAQPSFRRDVIAATYAPIMVEFAQAPHRELARGRNARHPRRDDEPDPRDRGQGPLRSGCPRGGQGRFARRSKS